MKLVKKYQLKKLAKSKTITRKRIRMKFDRKNTQRRMKFERLKKS
jgi:hypothetical protein